MNRVDKQIHIVGNSVLDLPLRFVPKWSKETADGWTAGNVHFLEKPVEAVLGGCGAATAYVLGKLGSLVSLNTQVGQDAFGQVIRGWLSQANVAFVTAPSDHTAVNVIPLGENGSRRSLYYTGRKIDWQASLEVTCDYFFASGYGQVDEGDIDVLKDVFAHMQSRGVCVVFDPGPWFMMRSAPAAMYAAWAHVDVLVGTQDELNTWMQKEDVAGLISHVQETGVKQVVVKCGKEGAAFSGDDGSVNFAHTRVVEQAYTVGAGDTFNAGLLHLLAQGQTLSDAVPFATDLATSAVASGQGALGAVP